MEKAQEAAAPAVKRGAESMREATDRALGQARTQVDDRTTQAGEQMRSVADAARQVGQNLRMQEGQEQPARIVDGVADRVDRLGSYLEDSDASSMLDELERLGRRSPTTVLAGGIVVGILAARFLKASSDNRMRTANGGGAVRPVTGSASPMGGTPGTTSADRTLPTPTADPAGVAGSPRATRETMPGQAAPRTAGTR
jgi:hypothetical protein